METLFLFPIMAQILQCRMTAYTPLLEEEIERAAPSNPTCSGTGVHRTFYVCGMLQRLASTRSQRQMKATGIPSSRDSGRQWEGRAVSIELSCEERVISTGSYLALKLFPEI